MFNSNSVLFLCLNLFILGMNAGVVSFIEPCHWNDVECVVKSARKAMPHVINGIPEIGMPSLNPLALKDIKGDNGDLKLKIMHFNVNRIPECNMVKVDRPEKMKIHLELECPISATGHYKVGGKLFIVPIEGEGNFEIKTEKIKIEATIILKEFKKDGKTYYKFASFDYKYEPIEKVHFKLENLYNGDEAKAKPVLDILDASWKEVTSDIGKPVIQEIIVEVIEAITKFFKSIPVEEIELP